MHSYFAFRLWHVISCSCEMCIASLFEKKKTHQGHLIKSDTEIKSLDLYLTDVPSIVEIYN